MADTELADLSATELRATFSAREASPVEAVESCLARIERLEPQVNAVLTLCAERCLEQAAVSTQRIGGGSARLLEGIPFGLKDVIASAGVRTTGGSAIYGDYVPEVSASIVERLEGAGALLLAKLQTSQFAFGDNPHYGPTRNPWDLERSPGASSSGPAAALAARELPLAVGTDTGGSIRMPAAFCGITGLKPTYGRIPRHGVMAQSWTLDHVGPMTRSAADAALMLTAMSGHDARDPTSSRRPVDAYTESGLEAVRGLRIGVPSDWFFELCDPEVAAATHAAIDTLASAGAMVVDVALPNAHLADVIGWTIMFAEFASLHEVHLGLIDEYGPGLTRELLAASQFVSAQDYLRALRTRHLLQRDFEAAFERVDALVTPGIPTAAPRLDAPALAIDGVEYPYVPTVVRTTLIYNLAGVPALSIPSGFNAEGLPVGIQIAARPFAEATCFRVAQAFQQLTHHHLARPSILQTHPASPVERLAADH